MKTIRTRTMPIFKYKETMILDQLSAVFNASRSFMDGIKSNNISLEAIGEVVETFGVLTPVVTVAMQLLSVALLVALFVILLKFIHRLDAFVDANEIGSRLSGFNSTKANKKLSKSSAASEQSIV